MHAYQNRAVNFIKQKKRCALFLDMGLGKTISTLTAISDLQNDFAVLRVLVIAPKRVANTVWKQEGAKWEHTKNLTFSIISGNKKQRLDAVSIESDIHVINRENTKWLVEQQGWKWDMVIVDESSSFKNHAAKRFKALKSIIHKTTYLVLLTGTPASNGYMGLWSQQYLVDFGKALGKNITAYRNSYFYFIIKDTKNSISDKEVYLYGLKPFAQKNILNLMLPTTLSMKACDYLNLPECIHSYDKIPMPKLLLKQQKDFIKSKVLEMEHEIDDITANSAAILAMKLAQFANGAMYNDAKEFVTIHDLKLEVLQEIYASSENMLVAYSFKSDVIRIKNLFPDAVILDNSQKMIDDWNAGKIKMLVAHPASAGHGLNIQHGGSLIVWFGLTSSLESYLQFNARLHRQGITMPVRIRHIMLENSYDDKQLARLITKESEQEAVIRFFKEMIT